MVCAFSRRVHAALAAFGQQHSGSPSNSHFVGRLLRRYVTSHRPLTTNHRPLATNHQPPHATTSSRRSIVPRHPRGGRRRLAAVGRLADPKQYARRQRHPRRMECWPVRLPVGPVAARLGQERPLGCQTRLDNLRYAGRGRRPSLLRHQQRSGLAETIPGRGGFGLSTLLRSERWAFSVAAFTREALGRPRSRLSRARHLLCADGRRATALDRHQSLRGRLSQHGTEGRPQRGRRCVDLRHD